MGVVLLTVSGVCNLQILNLKPRHVVHRNLEIHRQWPYLFPTLGGSRIREGDLGNQVVLHSSLELLYGPLRCLFIGFVFIRLPLHPFREFKCHVRGRSWYGEFHNHLGGKVILWELRSHLDSECEFVLRYLINEGVDPKRSRVLSVDSIIHDQEFSVGRVDRHSLHGLEISYIDALVEVAVV